MIKSNVTKNRNRYIQVYSILYRYTGMTFRHKIIPWYTGIALSSDRLEIHRAFIKRIFAINLHLHTGGRMFTLANSNVMDCYRKSMRNSACVILGQPMFENLMIRRSTLFCRYPHFSYLQVITDFKYNILTADRVRDYVSHIRDEPQTAIYLQVIYNKCLQPR